MRHIRTLLSILMASVLCLCSFSNVAFAATPDSQQEPNNYYSYEVYISQTDRDFLDKVASVSEFYYFEDDVVKISLSQDELMGVYGFSEDQYARLVAEVLVPLDLGGSAQLPPGNSTNAHVSNGTLYITHADLAGGAFAILGTAAAAGPAAMAAAINALSNMIPAPVGTILGVIVTVAAAPSLVELCGRVIYAISTGQGIYIRPVLSYPPLEIGYW